MEHGAGLYYWQDKTPVHDTVGAVVLEATVLGLHHAIMAFVVERYQEPIFLLRPVVVVGVHQWADSAYARGVE